MDKLAAEVQRLRDTYGDEMAAKIIFTPAEELVAMIERVRPYIPKLFGLED